MLSQCIASCRNLHDLCALVSDLKPVGSLGTREVRVMSADASDTIPISLIVNKFLEFTGSQSTFTPEEHADHQKILDKIKVLDEQAFTELQKNQLTQQLQAYLSDSTIKGNKALVVQRIQEAFDYRHESLYLDDLQITEVPSCLSMLPWLEVLSLPNNQLVTLPPEIKVLTQLCILDLSNNQLKTLPPEIKVLTQLRALHLSDNQLKNLLPGVKALTQLRTLDLSHNLLEGLPPEITALTWLEVLYLSHNQLKTLPPEVGALTQLRTLDLSHNQLKTLPPEVGALTWLEVVNLSHNQLRTLLLGVEALTQLRTLNLSHNQLESLLLGVEALTQLEELNLSHNQLRTLLPGVETFTWLKVLNLSYNQLTTLPSAFGALTQLQRLYLNYNQLVTLPPAFGALTHLLTLSLSNNRDLRELPLILGSLPGLTYIDTEDTALNRQVVDALLEQCAAIRRTQGPVLLPNRLQTWKAAGNSPVDLSDIERFTDDDKGTLNEWLVRLEQTKDFRGNQQPLAQTVCEMLHDMTRHAELKELFLAFMAANNEACADRSAQVLNELYTAWKLWQLPEDAPLSEQLDIMIRAANTLALRDAITACIREEEKKNGRPEMEAVEIQLYFGLEVEKMHHLPLLHAIREMHYAGVGDRTWIKVDDLVENVKDTYIDRLTALPSFVKVLASDRTFQEMWAPHENVFAEQMNALDDVARTEDVSKKIMETQYLSDIKMIENARKQKYKELVIEWLRAAV